MLPWNYLIEDVCIYIRVKNLNVLFNAAGNADVIILLYCRRKMLYKYRQHFEMQPVLYVGPCKIRKLLGIGLFLQRTNRE